MVQLAWERVQAGVNLADGLPTTPSAPREFAFDKCTGRWNLKIVEELPTVLEYKMVHLFRRQSSAADKMHCASRVYIQGRTIGRWFDPKGMSSTERLTFLRALGTMPGVIPRDVGRSKLVRELMWGGKSCLVPARGKKQIWSSNGSNRWKSTELIAARMSAKYEPRALHTSLDY